MLPTQQTTKRGNSYSVNRIHPTKNWVGVQKMRADQEAKPRQYAVWDKSDILPFISKTGQNKRWEFCEGLKHLCLFVLGSGPLKYCHKVTRHLTFYGLNPAGKERINRLRRQKAKKLSSPTC